LSTKVPHLGAIQKVATPNSSLFRVSLCCKWGNISVLIILHLLSMSFWTINKILCVFIFCFHFTVNKSCSIYVKFFASRKRHFIKYPNTSASAWVFRNFVCINNTHKRRWKSKTSRQLISKVVIPIATC
jgi:hypothetical protein